MSDWTKEEMKLAIDLFKSGMSASQITEVLPGRNRNSVIGKLHRYAVSQGHKPIPRVKRIWKNSSSKPPRKGVNTFWIRGKSRGDFVVPKMAPSKMRDACKGRKNLIELKNDECKWPFGDGGETPYTFCGLKQAGNSSYCEHHRDKSMPEWRRRINEERERCAPMPSKE